MTRVVVEAPRRPPPRERSARVDEIVDAARSLLEANGSDGLTMRGLGQALGIRAPSLYKHLSGRAALELALVETGLDEIGVALHRAAATSTGDPISSLLAAYRAVGLASPQLYRLVTAGTFPRAELPAGLEAWAGHPFYLVMGEEYLAQALWSFAHGTLILELERRFPDGSNLDLTWRAGTEAFIAARVAGAGGLAP